MDNDGTNRLRDRYTFLRPCVIDGFPDAHTVWLRVGVQSFRVGYPASDTKESAEWFRNQLAVALGNMIEVESKT